MELQTHSATLLVCLGEVGLQFNGLVVEADRFIESMKLCKKCAKT